MDERTVKFRVGVVVLATPLVLGILLALFNNVTTIARGTYPLYVHFSDAPGVSENTPVRKNGILIGRVTKTEFPPDGKPGVIITLEIQKHITLRQNEACRVKPNFLGDSIIEFVQVKTKKPDDDQTQFPVIKPGDYLTGTSSSNPMEVLANLEGNLTDAVDSVGHAGEEISKLAASLNKQLEGKDDQFARILEKTESSLDDFRRTLANIDGVVGDEEVQRELRRAIVEMPKLFEQSRDMLGRVQSTVESADRNLKNMEGLTKPLGDRGPELVNKIDSTVGRLDELLTQFVTFGRAINEPEGSLGQLTRNPELYQNLNKAALNIACLTEELKPIIRDARAFSDKIARHPELLGVRGAIQKSQGIK